MGLSFRARVARDGFALDKNHLPLARNLVFEKISSAQ
jgi:hypothetical protein